MGRMKKYGDGWVVRTFRVSEANRDYLEAVAHKVGFPLESVARMAIRRFAESRGWPLMEWAPLEPARAEAFFTRDVMLDQGMPRVYVRVRTSWLPHLTNLYRGEIRSLAGVIREAILHMAEENPADVEAAFAAEREPSK